MYKNVINRFKKMSLLLLLNPSFYFRLLIYMNSYNSTKLYINNQKKTDKPNTIVTWNITNLSIDFMLKNNLKILNETNEQVLLGYK